MSIDMGSLHGALGGTASASFLLFLIDNRVVLFFKVYCIAGTLLMAACLGLGSEDLLAPRRIAYVCASLVSLAGAVGVFFVLTASIDSSRLRAAYVEAGTALISGTSVAFVAILNTFGAAARIGGALYSAW